MDKASQRSIIGILIILVVAAGIAFAGSQGGYFVFGIPLFALCVALAFIINWIAFIPAYIRNTEKFFDLTGSLTYITVIVLAVVLSPEIDIRSLLLMGLISIWALRLGIFLFRRIMREGEDKRFKEIKQSASSFLLTWTIQGLWVSFTTS